MISAPVGRDEHGEHHNHTLFDDRTNAGRRLAVVAQHEPGSAHPYVRHE